MSVTPEELDGNSWKMMPNGREYKIVLKSSSVSKRCVSEDNNEIDVVCFITENRLKPRFADELVSRLTRRDEFVIPCL